jgi:WD40 repeat protein
MLKGRKREVVSVPFSADGNRLAAASNDETLRVWEAPPGAEDGGP